MCVCVGTGKPQCGLEFPANRPPHHPGLCVSHKETLCVSHTDTVSVPQREYLIILQREYLIIIQREYLIKLLYKGNIQVQVQEKSERAGSGTLTHPIWDKNVTK